MFGNLSASINEPVINYPIQDSSLPFSEYIKLTRAIVEERRTDLTQPGIDAELIINANSPYELYPAQPLTSGKQLKHGVLLIHGLLDSPFSLRDIGMRLQTNGMLSRAILLPGHGTTPSDLLKVSYHDWLQAVRYGVETLRREVEQIYLIGYSTGAALSIYQALQDQHIAGIVLLSPAIRIKAPASLVAAWHYLQKWVVRSNPEWIYRDKETDYVKYKSIAFNPVNQVTNLTNVIHELRQNHPVNTPVCMIMSREDETVSSHRAIDFFSSQTNKDSRLLLYTSMDHIYPDARILPRLTNYPDLQVQHFSHTCIPFAPNNSHYGKNGDYIEASHTDTHKYIYGAYNQIEKTIYDQLFNFGLIRYRRQELTYNPDFDYMSNMIVNFILGK